MKRRTLVFALRYRGDAAHGWQRQRHASSVQAMLEQAFADCHHGQPITVYGASRTDAGVHARLQIAAADVRADFSPKKWVQALNGILPDSIAAQWAAWGPAGFRPRGRCGDKTYIYRFLFRRVRDPLCAATAWFIPERVNLAHLPELAATWQTKRDFRAACSQQLTDASTTVRTLTLSRFEVGDPVSTFTVRSRGFLTHQVRILAGTLVAVGKGLITADDVAAALDAGDRQGLGATAPPHGLTLEHVELPDVTWENPWPTPLPGP